MSEEPMTVTEAIKARQRPKRPSSDGVRKRILDAAIIEFSAHGYDGASTRAIAKRAKANQPQVLYHYASKIELWRSAVNVLMEDFEASLLAGADTSSPLNMMKSIVRNVIKYMASHPELQRMVVHEGGVQSERLNWLVKAHLAERSKLLVQLWTELQAQGITAPISPQLFNYIFLGLTTQIYASAPEAKILAKIDTLDVDFQKQHADTVIALLFPGAN